MCTHSQEYFKVGESVYSVPWSRDDPSKVHHEIMESDWKRCRIDSVNEWGTYNVPGIDFHDEAADKEGTSLDLVDRLQEQMPQGK